MQEHRVVQDVRNPPALTVDWTPWNSIIIEPATNKILVPWRYMKWEGTKSIDASVASGLNIRDREDVLEKEHFWNRCR